MCILLFQKEHGTSRRTFICHSFGFPDSMTVERCFQVLIYFSVKKELQQANLHSLKGSLYTGMVFRPQNMIQGRQFQKIFSDKKRYESRPSVHIYKEREFISKFFLEGQLG